MIKLVMFDLDGTLGNTIPLTVTSFSDALSPYIGHRLTNEDVIATFGLDEMGMAKSLLPDSFEDAVRDYYELYEKRHDEKCKCPFDGIVDVLEFLNSHGVKIALITGKSKKSAYFTIQKFGIEKFFCDMIFGDPVKNKKTERMISLIEKYGFDKSECCYVGDAVSDATDSHDAGIVCLSAAWASTSDKTALQKTNPQYVLDDVSGLKDFFERDLLPQKN